MSGAVDEVCKGGMLVTFTGELGDVSLLSSTDVNVAVAENVKGQTAFRPAISKLTCTATSGTFTLRVNGMNVALNYNDDLATVKSKIGSLGSRYTVSVFDVTNENDTPY